MWVYGDEQVTQLELDPAELGVPRAEVRDLVGGDAAHNAGVVRDLLAGRTGPVRDVVLLNAAAALVADAKPSAPDLMDQFREQLARAAEAIDSGAAQRKLERWVQATRELR